MKVNKQLYLAMLLKFHILTTRHLRIKVKVYIREDHFEMNFIIKIYKLAKSLVKIGTSDAPRPILGPTPL